MGKRCFVRKTGDILQPAREDDASLRTMRAAICEFSFSAQCQQNPIPQGGAVIKAEWLEYYEPGSKPSKFNMIVQSWDTAT